MTKWENILIHQVKKVATVSKSGYVTIKGIGKTTITIKSAATSKYNASYKKITVQVVPKTMKINKIRLSGCNC